jgi:hypothetical protein
MRASSGKSDGVGIAEGARILGVSRSSAYWMFRNNAVAGAQLIGGLVWIAPRSSVLAAARRLASTQLLEHAS